MGGTGPFQRNDAGTPRSNPMGGSEEAVKPLIFTDDALISVPLVAIRECFQTHQTPILCHTE